MIYVIDMNESKHEAWFSFVEAGPEFEGWFNGVFLPWFRTMESPAKRYLAGEPCIMVVGELRDSCGYDVKTVEQFREEYATPVGWTGAGEKFWPPVPEYKT